MPARDRARLKSSTIQSNHWRPLSARGAARAAGDAVGARAVDGMREHEVRRCGRDRPRRRSFRRARSSGAIASISEVSASLACQSSASAKCALRTRALSVPELNSATIMSSCSARSISSAQRRGDAFVDMRIDDEEPAHAAMVGPVADLLDELDHRDGLKRERARPAAAVPERAAIGERRQHRNVQLAPPPRSARRSAITASTPHAEMRAVLFGRADGQDRRLASPPRGPPAAATCCHGALRRQSGAGGVDRRWGPRRRRGPSDHSGRP